MRNVVLTAIALMLGTQVLVGCGAGNGMTSPSINYSSNVMGKSAVSSSTDLLSRDELKAMFKKGRDLVFKYYDKNQDGELDVNENNQIFNKYDIDKYDLDKSGTLSSQEWHSQFNYALDEALLRKLPQNFIRNTDKANFLGKKDGKISQKEYANGDIRIDATAFVECPNPNIKEELFKKADKDNDASLGETEVLWLIGYAYELGYKIRS